MLIILSALLCVSQVCVCVSVCLCVDVFLPPYLWTRFVGALYMHQPKTSQYPWGSSVVFVYLSVYLSYVSASYFYLVRVFHLCLPSVAAKCVCRMCPSCVSV